MMTKLSKTHIDLAVAEAFLQNPEISDLSEYTSINAKGAAHLVNHSDFPQLMLGGLYSLDLASAQELTRFKGRVSLHGLKEISDEVAEALSSLHHSPVVRDPTIARAIGLLLGALPKEKAQRMVEFSLNTRVMREGALHFTYPLHSGCYLSLSREAAEVLVSVNPPLVLHHITTLEPEVAEMLSQKLHLTFSNLHSLSLDSMQALLGGATKSIYFDKLNPLNAEMAEVLVGADLMLLALNGISEMDGEVAKVFSGLQKEIQLSFNGMQSMSVEVARNLSKMGDFKALSISFKNLKSLSYEAVQALAEFKGAIMTFGRDMELCEQGKDLFSKRKRLMLV